MSPTPATPAGDPAASLPAQAAEALERLATLHDETEWGLRGVAELLREQHAENAELRDEVLAIANRLEAVTQLLLSRPAAAPVEPVRVIEEQASEWLVRRWNEVADCTDEAEAVEAELGRRGFAPRSPAGEPLHLSVLRGRALRPVQS